jgi:hypothetical protein
MIDQECNGWANRETWLTNLWIAEGLLGDPMGVEEQARAFAEAGESAAPHRMAEWLREQTEASVFEGLLASGFTTDLLGAALARVDWAAIGRNYTDTAIENERQQTENANAEPIGHWSHGYTEPTRA